jgi:CubicO group peptidase (beta-lactamase class C family)
VLPVVALLEDWAGSGREPGGAVCVLRDGAVVVDHCVGTADGVRPWTPDTLVMTWSVAKPFAALTVLSVVAEGRLGLDQRVAEVWPAYGVRGKEPTTVRHVLSHAAGLACFPAAAAELAFDDREALTALLAGAEPDHPPGAAVAEHALTYGHLCDALVRATTGEDLADRFARIAAHHGWDVHLRVPGADLARVADVVALPGWPGHYLTDPRWGPALGRPPGLYEPDLLNSERFRTASFPAVAMHASAHGLARFYADLVAPDGPVAALLGPTLHAAYVSAQASGHDRVLDREVTWTLGFQLDEDDLGMGGAGGCSAWWSFRGEYAAAYVTRGMGDHARGDAVWAALGSARS